MADPTPPTDRLLLVGPSGSGKTRRTAEMLDAWVRTNDADGVVVMEFAPEFKRDDGQILGRRLDRFIEIPDGALYLMVETQAPRAGAPDLDEALAVAKENEAACATALQALPQQITALFVNDATMAYHPPDSDPTPLLEAINQTDVAVVNALDPQGFDPEHPITEQEHKVMEKIAQKVDRVERLPPQPPLQEGQTG